MMEGMRRGQWNEVELAEDPDALVLCHPDWIRDAEARESLSLAIREAGWFRSTGEAFDAAANADLRWGWIGDTEERTVVICSSGELTRVESENVSDVRRVTLARIVA
jgi:hypothetical protein